MPLSNSQIKYIKSLSLKKFRQKYNNFVVEGDKMLRELLSQSRFEIEAVYALEPWFETLPEEMLLPENKAFKISITSLKKISSLKTPNQAVGIVKMPVPEWNESKIGQELSLYLDGIQDPGNMGAILRVADWFGISNIFLSKGCVDIYNAKVIQASMGAFLRVKVMDSSLEALVEKFPSLPVYGAVMDGADIYQTTLAPKGIIVIGNEGAGISESNLNLLTDPITIPAHTNSGTESLNAAVATGIICALFRASTV